MVKNNPKLEIRISENSDAPYLKQWLSKPDILRWFPMINELEIEDSIRIWLSYIEKKATFTITLEGKPCGMLVLYLHNFKKISHQTLFAIIVDENVRGQGIGSELLKYAIEKAKTDFQVEVLHLEIYEGNPAISLYKRLGFEEFGRHLNFLKEGPGQYLTKILMQKTL